MEGEIKIVEIKTAGKARRGGKPKQNALQGEGKVT